MIRVLVSDLGKVLLPFDTEKVWTAVLPHVGCSEEEARALLSEAFRDSCFGSGGCTGDEFHARLESRLGLKLPYDAFRTAWSDMFWEDEAVLDLIRRAKVERRHLLSNTNEIHWWWIQDRYAHVLQPFDDLIVSHEVKLEKPAAAIYHLVCDRTGLPPEAHLFIDDIEANVEGARAIGMDAVLHTDAASLEAALRQRGLID